MTPRARAMSAALSLVALLSIAPADAGSPDLALRWGTPGSGRGELRSPASVAVRGDRVYVADFDNDRIQVFTRVGEALLEWGSAGSEFGQFHGPAGVATDAEGLVYVADLHNHRIQKFTAEGAHVASWPAGGPTAAPCGIAVDARGWIYVTDLDAGRVRSWSSDGEPRGEWGVPGRGRGELIEPWGIVADESGDVFVADHGNHQIQRFSADGTWLGQWGALGTGSGQLLGPMGLAIGPDGSLLVTDLTGRVQRFSRDGAPLSLERGSSPGAAPSTVVPALAVDADGAVFLADMTGHRIERLDAPVPGGTEGRSSAPSAFDLAPLSPLPSPGPVVLRLTIPVPGMLAAEIFSVDGRRVYAASLSCEPGEHRVTWDARTTDGRPASSGIYVVRVRFDDGARRVTRSGRIVLLR